MTRGAATPPATAHALAEILMVLDRPAEAMTKARLAQDVALQLRDRHEEAKTLRLLATIHTTAGRTAKARAATAEAATIARELERLL